LKKIIAIVGARPQFIKHYPFEREASKWFDLKTIHTGQHYDENMSAVFFNELGMKAPDYLLNLGGGSHGLQTGKMMIDIEEIILKEKPDAIVVYGDTNSTLAGSLVGAKLHIPIYHIEAGLRSYNKDMPEEINRILTDHISSLLLVPSQKSVDNLLKEGIDKNVHIVGDIMKDLLLLFKNSELLKKPSIKDNYYYVTLHRPYNVDKEDRLKYILDALAKLDKQVVFPMHPRTKNKLKEFNIDISDSRYNNISIIDPQSYKENLSYLYYSSALITDSGGMQKEAYWLEKPCITIRTETEWVETLSKGANTLLFDDLSSMNSVLKNNNISYNDSLYGSGNASQLICNKIKEDLA
jgi:UDP-GlcNAc3NAcA epimerase